MLKDLGKYEQPFKFLFCCRCIVKNFLDNSGLVIPSFKDNAPGPDWGRYFIKVRILQDQWFIFSLILKVKLAWGCKHFIVLKMKK